MQMTKQTQHNIPNASMKAVVYEYFCCLSCAFEIMLEFLEEKIREIVTLLLQTIILYF